MSIRGFRGLPAKCNVPFFHSSECFGQAFKIFTTGMYGAIEPDNPKFAVALVRVALGVCVPFLLCVSVPRSRSACVRRRTPTRVRPQYTPTDRPTPRLVRSTHICTRTRPLLLPQHRLPASASACERRTGNRGQGLPQPRSTQAGPWCSAQDNHTEANTTYTRTHARTHTHTPTASPTCFCLCLRAKNWESRSGFAPASLSPGRSVVLGASDGGCDGVGVPGPSIWVWVGVCVFVSLSVRVCVRTCVPIWVCVCACVGARVCV